MTKIEIRQLDILKENIPLLNSKNEVVRKLAKKRIERVVKSMELIERANNGRNNNSGIFSRLARV